MLTYTGGNHFPIILYITVQPLEHPIIKGFSGVVLVL